MDVLMLTVGPLAENCFILRASEDATEAVIVDPGDEPDRILAELETQGIERLRGILLTHCHYDHIGAVPAVARATGAQTWCPRLEVPLLVEPNDWLPLGVGPFEPHHPEHLVGGGERLELAGLSIEVLPTPGHSPGHVSYSVRSAGALFSGDVLFQGSVGRVDLPGGDWPQLQASLRLLVESLPPETVVHPGHMGLTTIGDELGSNPFLEGLDPQAP